MNSRHHTGKLRPGNVARICGLCAAVVLLYLLSAELLGVPAAAVLSSGAAQETPCPAGFTVLPDTEWEALTASLEETAMDPSAVLYDGARISYVDAAYTADGCTYYVPQDPDSPEWDGWFTGGSEAQLYILEDEGLSDKAASLQEGRVFSCLYVSGQTFSRFSLIMTGLPTVSIEYDNRSPLTSEGEDHDGSLYIRESDGGYTASACTIHVRGNLSREFVKKSYKISLKDAAGDNSAVSLCGMRSDDDWILNALYMDETRTHEVLAYHVWEEILALSGRAEKTAQLTYVEVFLNNEYTGLYALMERVDAMTFALEDGDVLYKIQSNTDDDIIKLTWPAGLTQYNGQEEIEGAKIEWPKAEKRAAAETDDGSDAVYRWDILEDCYQFVKGDLSLEDLADKGIRLDEQSIACYELLVVLSGASDNTWKNSFLICTLQKDGGYLIAESPWDLNGTWGDDYAARFQTDSADDQDYTHSDLWSAWYRDDPEGAWQAVCEVWQSLRDNDLSADTVCEEARDLWTDLLISGSIYREADLWPSHVNGDNYEQMLEWIRTRFDTLDDYYEYADSP